MPTITKTVHLQQALMKDVERIINVVAEKALNILQQKMDDIVYDPYETKRSVYRPLRENGGLYSSWERSNAQVASNTVTSVISQDSQAMVLNRLDNVHGSIHKDINWDIREDLTRLIVTGASGKRFGEGFWTESRDFWGEFIKIFEDGTIDRMLKEEFSKKGIKLIGS